MMCPSAGTAADIKGRVSVYLRHHLCLSVIDYGFIILTLSQLSLVDLHAPAMNARGLSWDVLVKFSLRHLYTCLNFLLSSVDVF